MRRKDLGTNHGDPSWKQTTGRHVALHLVPEPVSRLMVNQQRNLDIGRYTKATEPGKILEKPNYGKCWISCVFMNFPNQPRCFGKRTQNPLRKFRIDYLWLVENFAVIQVTLHLTCPILTSNPKSPTVPWHMDFKSAPPPRPFKIPALKLCSLSPGAALRNALPQCLERHCRANYSELFIATQVLRSSFCMFSAYFGTWEFAMNSSNTIMPTWQILQHC